MPRGIYIRTEEYRKNVRKSRKGKYHSEETKRKIRETKKGSHHSLQARKKIGEGHMGEKSHLCKPCNSKKYIKIFRITPKGELMLF